MKKIVSIMLIGFIALLSMGSAIPVRIANAGQDDYIMPLFSGYIEDINKATLLSQDTVIDMSNYNGVGKIGDNAGEIIATTNYCVFNTQTDSIFCVPYLGTIEELNQMEIIVNGQEAKTEILYGKNPLYSSGVGKPFISIVEAIENVQPTTIKDEMATIYSFAPTGGELEYSFHKNDNQTVIYDGAGWIRHSVNDYSFKVSNSESEEYPYRLFVTNGELTAFQSNVEYSVFEISYKDYIDYYLNEIIADMGEEYRPLFYSKFNGSLTGTVLDVVDTLFDYSPYAFALMKIELPIGDSRIAVKTVVSPLVKALYKPYIYIVRMVSPYSQACEYSLEVKMSEKLPYLLEDNIGLSKMRFTGRKQISDGYYVVGSKENIVSVLDKNNTQNLVVFYILSGFFIVVGSIGFFWIFYKYKDKKRR